MGCLDCCCECFTDGHIGPATFKRATKRSCTDVLFLILFVLFFVGTGVIAYVSYQQGDWRRLVYGFDDYGNICGIKNEKIKGAPLSGMDMTNKSKVFFMLFSNDFIKFDLSYTAICVEDCPRIDATNTSDFVYEMYTKGYDYCQYDQNPKNAEEYMELTTQHKCPSIIYSSHPLLRRCMPDIKAHINIAIQYFEKVSWLEYAFTDVTNAWKQILGMCAVSVVIAALMTVLVRFLAKFLIYVATLLFIVGSIAAICAVWYIYVMEYKKLQAIPADERLTSQKDQVDYFLYLAIAVSIVMGCILLILLVMFPRMKVVVKLFEEASRVVQSIPLILFTPIFTFVMLTIFFGYWLFVMLFVATAEKVEVEAKVFVRYVPTEAYVRYFWWYMLIAIIWGSEFIMAAHQFVIAFATSKCVYHWRASSNQWYNFEDKSQLHCPITKGIICLIKNHLGSIALGSFVITLVKVPRYVLMYIDKKLKGSENAVAKAILKCMQCCLWCLEKVLKFLNKNAYIVIAMTGKSFCPSAQQAVVILVSNALRVVALNSVGAFVIFLCKAGVAAITAAIGLVWFKYIEKACTEVGTISDTFFCEDADLTYYFIPAICAAVFAYFVASCFFGVFELVLDTLLVCVSEDTQVNDAIDGPEEMKTLKANPEFMRNLKDAHDQYGTVRKQKFYESMRRKKLDMTDNATKDEKPAEEAV